ncbi:MAG: DUF4340 domain-containing protein [Anaerolineales bacterium]|jgi:hypothetical protein
MMKKNIQILSILLVLQIALTGVVFWPRSAAAPESGEPLLPDLSADEVQQIFIEDGDGDAITLARTEAGWVLPDIDDYPVLSDKVDTLIDGLLAIDTSRLIAQTESSQRRLKVAADEFERKIVLSSAAATLRTIYLGSAPSFGSAHVRLEGDLDIYLTDAIAAHQANADAASWVDTVYLSVPREEIQSIRLKNANGTFEFEKDEEGNWNLVGLAEGEQLNASAMSNLETRAASINMTEPLGLEDEAAFGLAEPLATLVIETADNTITLHVGAYDEESSSYVVSSSESPYYVRVSEFAAQSLVENTRDDFVQLLPTATPEVVTEEVPAEGEGTPGTGEATAEATPTLEAPPTPGATSGE